MVIAERPAAVAGPGDVRLWRHEMVRVAHLKIDPAYHDPGRFQARRAERYAAAFDPDKAGTIVVSDRGDDMIVIDGYHRVHAARLVGVEFLSAKVYFGITRQKEADIFVGLSDAQGLRAISKFIARLGADEPVAKGIVGILDECGVRIARHGGQARDPRSTRSVGTIEVLHRADLLADTVTVVREAWPEDQRALDSVPLAGVGSFLYVYRTHPRYRRDRLLAKLAEQPVGALIRLSKDLRALPGNESTRKIAGSLGQWAAERRAVLRLYNARLQQPLEDVGMSDLKRLSLGQAIWGRSADPS